MNRDNMNLKKTIHSHYIRWGVCTTEPEGFFHGARVGSPKTKRVYRRGSDVRDRIIP